MVPPVSGAIRATLLSALTLALMLMVDAEQLECCCRQRPHRR
jgi:hypothetical protein